MSSAEAIRKSSSAADHAVAMANADNLFLRSALETIEPDRRGNTDYVGVHKYISAMKNEGRDLSIKMTVKETRHGNNTFYSIQSIEVLKSESSPSVNEVGAKNAKSASHVSQTSGSDIGFERSVVKMLADDPEMAGYLQDMATLKDAGVADEFVADDNPVTLMSSLKAFAACKLKG